MWIKILLVCTVSQNMHCYVVKGDRMGTVKQWPVRGGMGLSFQILLTLGVVAFSSCSPLPPQIPRSERTSRNAPTCCATNATTFLSKIQSTTPWHQGVDFNRTVKTKSITFWKDNQIKHHVSLNIQFVMNRCNYIQHQHHFFNMLAFLWLFIDGKPRKLKVKKHKIWFLKVMIFLFFCDFSCSDGLRS